MEYREFSAKTVEEAVTEACRKLGVISEDLEYEVVEKGSDGILGLGKKPWKLTNTEKKELVDTMNKPNKDFPDYTNWQITLAQYNMDNFGIDRIDTINGTFDKKEFPKAFTIDTPMPNYLELE